MERQGWWRTPECEIDIVFTLYEQAGEEHEDVLMCEMNIPNEDYLKVLQNACESHERYEFQLGFYLSDWNGKKIQNIRLYNASKPL